MTTVKLDLLFPRTDVYLILGGGSMSILTIIAIAVIGYLVFHYLIPMLPEPIKTVVVIVLVLLAIYFLLTLIGIRL